MSFDTMTQTRMKEKLQIFASWLQRYLSQACSDEFMTFARRPLCACLCPPWSATFHLQIWCHQGRIWRPLFYIGYLCAVCWSILSFEIALWHRHGQCLQETILKASNLCLKSAPSRNLKNVRISASWLTYSEGCSIESGSATSKDWEFTDACVFHSFSKCLGW